MKDNINVGLSLLSEEAGSQLRTIIYESELKEINFNFPLSENQIDIKKIYMIKTGNTLESEFFIRNSLSKNISLENVFLVVKDKEGNVIASKEVNFKEPDVIPPLSGRPYCIKFDIDSLSNFNEKEEYFIEFDNAYRFNAFYSVETEIENIPIDLDFEEEKAIRDFANTLKTLKVGEFSVSCYKMKYNEFRGIDCVLLLRNGTDKAANVDNLPISLIDENEQLIVRKAFKNEQDMLTVNFKKSKIVTLQFKANELPNREINLSNCKVIFK
jgi:SLAP domain-containing protein